MGIATRVKYIQLPNGGVVEIDPNELFQSYFVYTGFGTLNANVNIYFDGTPTTPVHLKVYVYPNGLDYNGSTIKIFGNKIRQKQWNNGMIIDFQYDLNDGGWRWTVIENSADNAQSNQFAETYTIPSGGDFVDLQAYQNGQFINLVGTGTLTGNYIITANGDQPEGLMYFIKYSATLTASAATVTIFGHTLDQDEMLLGNSMCIAYFEPGNGWNVQHLIGGYTNLSYEFETISASFESGEQCKNRIYIPYNFRLNTIRAVVTKALAGTNAGTVTVSINGGATTPSVLSLPASSALDYEDVITFTAGNEHSAGSYIDMTTAKVTAGGKILLTLTLKRTA